MKVLYLNSNYRGEGTFNRCYRLARWLVKKDCRVTMLTITSDWPSRKVRRTESEGVELIELPALTRRMDYLGYLLRPWVASRLARKETFDLVHAFTAAEPMVGLPALKLAGLKKNKNFPLLVDWDDWYSRGGLVELKPFKPLLRPMTRYLEESLPQKADAVTVVSEALRERARSLGVSEERIHLIGNGAEPERYEKLDSAGCRKRTGLPAEGTLVLYMGMYNQAAPMAIRAFFEAAGDREDVFFVCLGDISIRHHHLREEAELVRRARRDARFHFLGRVPGEEVPDYLAAADILLLPMKDTVVERARFPIRLGDYLSSGKALVASDVGEVGRIIREYGCGLTAADDREFTHRLGQLIEDPDRRTRLGLLAKRTAKKELHWEHLAGRMLEVYQGCL
jgi:glycosyltransferase involved in cell wall biosynthesis